MTKFEKPGSRDWDYPEMVAESVGHALTDARLRADQVEHASVGYIFADSCAGQRALYPLGIAGIPIVNVNNNCSTGSTALWQVRQLIQAGVVDVGLAVGFEVMGKGSISSVYPDRTQPLDVHAAALERLYPRPRGVVPNAWLFGAAARKHMAAYGSTPEHFAMIGEKNHRHSVNNPFAQFQQAFTLEEVLNSPPIYEPVTKLQCSPTSEGSAAAVLMSEDAVERAGLEGQAVEIVGQALRTDAPGSVDTDDAFTIIGADMTRTASQAAFDEAGMGPEDVQVVELHDCFSPNELVTYEGLGLAPKGEGHLLLDRADTTYGGRWVVNPSGGLISKGHPIGATGLAQCAELTWQLRGQAGARQVANASAGLQHNLGLGGAAVVTLYRAMGRGRTPG